MTPLFLTICSLLFTLGFLVHCLFAASNSVRDKRTETKRAWFFMFWVTILVRWGIMLIVFLVYANNAALLNHVLSLVGIPFSQQYSFPVTKTSSPIIGYFADSILDLLSKVPKLSFLSREIPQY